MTDNMMRADRRGRASGRARDVRPEEYRVDLSAACLDEIRRAADEIRAYPLPTILRAPG